MPIFEIETYKVSSYLERFPGETRPGRVLELAGPMLYHGIQNRALFAFSSFFDGIWREPVAGFITDGSLSGLSVLGWFPLTEFHHYYEIVRTERPVHVQYEYREPGSTTGPLRLVGLGTSTEPVGEGPSDSIEAISASLASYLTSPGQRIIPMPMQKDLPIQER